MLQTLGRGMSSRNLLATCVLTTDIELGTNLCVSLLWQVRQTWWALSIGMKIGFGNCTEQIVRIIIHLLGSHADLIYDIYIYIAVMCSGIMMGNMQTLINL